MTVALSTELAPYRPGRERVGLRPRLRSIATATAGIALTGALLGGAALATYAATNPESTGTVCTDPAVLGMRISEQLEDGEVVESWCADGGGYVAATVDYPGGSGGDGEGSTERRVWRIEGEDLVAVTGCTDTAMPPSIIEFLECV
nr:hypothetical protein GCM10025732_17360 [Glycomyces mayteni]